MAVAITVYRAALQATILRILTAARGDGFADAIADGLPPERRARFRRKVRLGRLDDDALRLDDLPSMLQHHWELFSPHLGGDRDLIRRMTVITEWWREHGRVRTGDVAAAEAAARLTDIADLLERVGEPARAVEVRWWLNSIDHGKAADERPGPAAADAVADPTPRPPVGVMGSPADAAGAERARHSPEREAPDAGTPEALEARITDLDRSQRALEARLARQAQYAVLQELEAVGAALTAARRSLLASRAVLDEARRNVEALAGEGRPDGDGFRRRRESLDAKVADARERSTASVDDLEQALQPVTARVVAEVQDATTQSEGDAPWRELNVLGAARRHFEAGVAEVEQTQRDLAAHLGKQARAAGPPLTEPGHAHPDPDRLQQQSSSRSDSSDPLAWVRTRWSLAIGLAAAAALFYVTCATDLGLPATPDESGPERIPVVEHEPAGSSPRTAVIMNTGPDGIGPSGAGVPHYRHCIADPQFVASDRRWEDGTRVQVLELGEGVCFSWLLVAAGGAEFWVGEEYVWPLLSDPGDEVMVIGAPSSEAFFHEVFETRVRLAVFRDPDGNTHWLPVEEAHRSTHSGVHQTGFRGKFAGAFRNPPQGGDLGYSWAALDSYGKILGIGTVAPHDEVEARPGGPRALSTRIGWFKERGIEAGSYMELYDFPVRLAPGERFE